jgi:hypothetical protein
MEVLRTLSNALQCPNCFAFDGFSYLDLRAQCKKCNHSFDIFDLFETLLIKTQDSELWSFPFAIISEFNLAPVFQSILTDEGIQLRPFHLVEIDFGKRGLPENARILYINISPYSRGNTAPATLGFAYLGSYSHRSISELPHSVKIVPYPHPSSVDDWPDPAQFLHAGIMVRWYQKGSNGVVSDHLVRAAEAYWKNDLLDMIYYGFTAFEISLSNLVDDFWKVGFRFSKKEYDSFFGRDSVDKRMRLHLPLLCRELGLLYSDDARNRFIILHDLRNLRNAVVHDGQVPDSLPHPKGKLFAALCWGLLFLKELRDRVDLSKTKRVISPGENP